ncbi:hypothetical protein KI387_017430, partial [Taxus chinensis]
VIIKKYTDVSAHGNKYAALASVTGSLTWPTQVSPNGRLLESSTMEDSMVFPFAEGTSEFVPASYIEFYERLVSHEYENLPVDKSLFNNYINTSVISNFLSLASSLGHL